MTRGRAIKNRSASKFVVSRHQKYSSTARKESPQVNKLTPNEVKEIDIALGRFFFGCNISFNVLKSQLFKDFIARLIPSEIYQLPTRKTLSTTILDSVYNDVVTQRVSVSGSEGVLLIDGWKNSSANKQNVVCTIHCAGSKSLFLNSWDMTGVSESGEELKRIVNEAMVLAKDKFNIDIYAVVSDNASNMIKMGKNIDIWHTTCHSHSGNLLAKALVPKLYAQSINKLLREFKSPGAENEIIKNGGSRIILACDTRWCSYRDSFRCLLKNCSIIKQLIKDKKISIINDDSRNLFEDSSFENNLQDYILIFDPICQLINICQKSDSSLADACQEWLKLEIPTDNDVLEEIVGARQEKVLTPIVLAANLLHPLYRGINFKYTNQHETACDFLEQELTIEDSINNTSLITLRTLIDDINTCSSGKDLDLKNIELISKKALDADFSGSKSKSITLYGSAIKLISSVVDMTSNLHKKKELKYLQEKIIERVTTLKTLVEKLELNDFLNDTGIFGKLKKQGFQSPSAFWTVSEFYYPKLSSLALKLLKIPAASAQLERLFSSWAFVHSDIRNRLTVERSMKLVDIYYSLKMNELYEEDYDGFIIDENDSYKKTRNTGGRTCPKKAFRYTNAEHLSGATID